MTDNEIAALAKRKGVGVARAADGWWTVWKGGCIAQMRDENLLKSLHEMPDKKLDPWMVIGCSIGAVLGLWLVWCLAVWSCRFTVWMGTQAQILP